MKSKLLKLALPCIASFMALCGCEKNDPNSVDFSKDTYKGTYYNGYDLYLTGSKLRTELQKLCFDTHTVFVKYSDYSSKAKFNTTNISSEAAPSTVVYKDDGSIDYNASKAGGKNEYFYTGKVATGIGTREHVWPCANSANLWVHDDGAGKHNVDGSGYKGGGSDLYHIRPSNSTVNTARGNSKFVDFDDPEFADIRSEVAEVGENGGVCKLKIQGFETSGSVKSYAQKAEPADEYKGDIARILVYVWVHYGYNGKYYNHEDMIGRLDLMNVMGYGNNQKRTYEKLKEWNELDPPSETEKLRNDTVQKIQGNRNPFVDHPSLMRTLLR